MKCFFRTNFSEKGAPIRFQGKSRLGFYPLPLSGAQRIRRFLLFPDQPSSALDPCVGDGVVFEAITSEAQVLRYGIEELRIIYGSADRAEGTLRQAAQEAIREASGCVAAWSFRDSYGVFAAEEESIEVRVKLASNPRPRAQDRKMVFVAFTSRYDTERHRHGPYYPLRSSGRN